MLTQSCAFINKNLLEVVKHVNGPLFSGHFSGHSILMGWRAPANNFLLAGIIISLAGTIISYSGHSILIGWRAPISSI